jgi:hypothetical protein
MDPVVTQQSNVNESANAVLAETSSPPATKNFTKRAIARRFMQLTYVELDAESNKHVSRRFQRRGLRFSVFSSRVSTPGERDRLITEN